MEGSARENRSKHDSPARDDRQKSRSGEREAIKRSHHSRSHRRGDDDRHNTSRRDLSRSGRRHRSRDRRTRSRSRSLSSSASRRRSRRNKGRHRKEKERKSSKKYRGKSSSSSSTSSGTSSNRRRTGIVSNDDDDDDDNVTSSNQHPIAGHDKHKSGDTPKRKQHGHHYSRNPNKNLKHGDSESRDDTVGHFEGQKGTTISDRFRIIREVGVGTFGRVLECVDMKRNEPPANHQLLLAHAGREKAFVAIKMVRKIKRYRDAALVEARIIQDINRRGGRGLTHCVRLRDTFDFAGHYCLVFESLGPSLHDFLKRNKFRGFPMACVRDFAFQLLEAVDFIHSMNIIHTDLKIENILLVSDKVVDYQGQLVPESTRLKLIDFGGSCYDHEKKSSVINTRQYRAPEVMLGTGWSMPSDIWSLGCILVELYRGELLFGTHDNVEHLALIERIVGYFPYWMVHEAKRRRQHGLADEAFNSSGYHRMERVLSPDSYEYVCLSWPLYCFIKVRDGWFYELVRRMLVIDPYKRATASECLQFLGVHGRA